MASNLTGPQRDPVVLLIYFPNKFNIFTPKNYAVYVLDNYSMYLMPEVKEAFSKDMFPGLLVVAYQGIYKLTIQIFISH